jgi:hypothetical protein
MASACSCCKDPGVRSIHLAPCVQVRGYLHRDCVAADDAAWELGSHCPGIHPEWSNEPVSMLLATRDAGSSLPLSGPGDVDGSLVCHHAVPDNEQMLDPCGTTSA